MEADLVELQADQIASLYTLLSFRDRPTSETETRASKGQKSVFDILRMVKDTLGDEGMRRLEEDGVLNLKSRTRGGRTVSGER